MVMSTFFFVNSKHSNFSSSTRCMVLPTFFFVTFFNLTGSGLSSSTSSDFLPCTSGSPFCRTDSTTAALIAFFGGADFV